MKIPKEIKRYCPKCKTHTTQKVKNEKNRGKNKTHPLTRFSKTRMLLRGLVGGMGNDNKLSKGAQGGWKRFNKKHSKKTDLRYACTVCKKTNLSSSSGTRTKKVQIE